MDEILLDHTINIAREFGSVGHSQLESAMHRLKNRTTLTLHVHEEMLQGLREFVETPEG